MELVNVPLDGRGPIAVNVPARTIAASTAAASMVLVVVSLVSVELTARHGTVPMLAHITDSARMAAASAILDTLVKIAVVAFAQITAPIAEFAAILPAVVIPGTLGSIALSHHVPRIARAMDTAAMEHVTALLDGRARHVTKLPVVEIAMLMASV